MNILDTKLEVQGPKYVDFNFMIIQQNSNIV